MNKFIKTYRAFWNPKVGDRVKIIKLLDENKRPIEKWHYNIGDQGVIHNLVLTTTYGYAYDIKFDNNNQDIITAYKEEIELL
jgi:hypothetical protein